MMLALSVTLGTLLGWHIYLITHNMTTIEVHHWLTFHSWLHRLEFVPVQLSNATFKFPFASIMREYEPHGWQRNLGWAIVIHSISVFTKILPWYWPPPFLLLFDYHLCLYVFYRLLNQVLGPNTLRWFCPTSTSHLKDGVGFPTLRDSS